jgi:inner membrane protein
MISSVAVIVGHRKITRKLSGKVGAAGRAYTLGAMDNLTHTLIGALVGEVTARVTTKATLRTPNELPDLTRRNLCVALAAVGSNLPDSDLLYSFFGGKVNYLLHHRGHTHTVLIALLLGVVVLGCTLWWLRRRRLRTSPADRLLLGGVLLFTPLLHIAMDFSNNYGVHPFWPMDNRWFYGDSIFIIEPLFWAACAPLAFVFRTRPARVVIWMVLVIATSLVFFIGLVPRPLAIIYFLIVIAMLLIGWRTTPTISLTAAVSLWLGATLMFVIAAQSTKARVDALAAEQFPGSEFLDRVVSPMPTSPLCWEIMLVQKEQGDVVLRRAMFALAPSLLAADGCLTRSLDLAITAPLTPVTRSNDRQIKWYGQIRSPLEQLRTVAKTNCEAAAAMRFIRAPWLAKVEDGPVLDLVLGDLRYDREATLGFAEIVITGQSSCPPFVPHWRQPRHDLLSDQN